MPTPEAQMRRDIDAAIQATVRRSLATFSALAAVVVLFFVASNLIRQAPASPLLLVAPGALVTYLVVVGYLAHAEIIPARFCNAMAALTQALFLALIASSSNSSSPVNQNSYGFLLIILMSFVYLSWFWATSAIFVSVAVLGIAAAPGLLSSDPGDVDWYFLLGSSAAAALIIHQLRISSTSRMERLRLQLEGRNVELQASREILSEAHDIARTAGWHRDLASMDLVVSAEFSGLLGLPPMERMRLEDYLGLLHPDDRERVRRCALDVAESAGPISEDYRILSKHGAVRWVTSRKRFVCDSKGTPVRAVGTIQDISERKVAELAEKKLREELAEAHRIAQLGSWTWDAETDRVEWSAELFRLLGREPALGPTTFLRCASLQTPGNIDTLQQTQEAAMMTGAVEDLDLEVIVPNGPNRWVSLHSEIIGEPGAIVGLRGTMQDITRRKVAEIETTRRAHHKAELRSVSAEALTTTAMPALLATVAHRVAVGLNVPIVAFFEFDPSGRTLTLRASDGLPPELAGAAVKVQPDDQFGSTLQARGPVIVTDIANETRFHAPALLVEHGIASGMSVAIHTQSGPYGVIAALAPTPRGFDLADADFIEGVANIVASALDRGRAETVLRRNERLTSLGTLVAGVAHEINNPLMYIQGSVELIQKSARELAPGLPAPQAAIVETIGADADVAMRGLERIGLITKGLRQVARAAGGPWTIESLDAIVAGILPVARPRMGPNVHVETDFQSRALVECNANEISQVVLNLLFNAGDAMGEKGGLVRVRTSDARGSVTLTVGDTGVGIPAEKRQQIFTPFFTTKPNGTGLGLSICHSIVAEHGGSLTFDSEEGAGTTFRMQLPAAKVPIQKVTA